MFRPVYERIFPRWKPRAELRPRGKTDGAELSFTWLGTASFVVKTASTTILIDPFISRQGLGTVAFGKISPDDDAIARHMPKKVDAILCGHSHYDHIADAPRIAKGTGAKLVGSRTTCAWGRAEGLQSDKLVPVPPEGKELRIGDIDVRFIPSRHGRVKIGPFRVPTLPGDVDIAPRGPSRATQYKMGGAFGIWIKAGGTSAYHNGSADLVDAELDGIRADILLACLAGRRGTENYVKRLVRHLEPSLVVPAHHDAFFAPLDEGVHLLPGIDVDGFVDEVRMCTPNASIVTPGYDETLFIPPSDARGAVLAG